MFYADLHVHSKFSRATSRDSDLEHLALWAAKKGISVVATGDFTHPGWFAEIQQKLVPAEPGLYRLRPDLEHAVRGRLDRTSAADVRFMLQVEISTIYKTGGQTRKVHHLVYVPDFQVAQRLTQSLSRIGNVRSDGRPILGLDSRHLLEMVLDSGEGAYLVPAHIWTPWFAVLGSMSGFEAIEDCYGPLTPEVFALETGLSSDPPMNWRLSALDRYALVSNSDAHSPARLGREACVLDTPLDYFAIRQALKTGQGYCGTVEFFPEEGKYHFDGHRKCGVCLAPEQTRLRAGRCPACQRPLTLGVMHRVCQLADRDQPPEPLPARAAPFRSLVPLEEVLAEIQGVGPQAAAVQRAYEELIARLGPELFILEHAPLEQIARAGWPLLAEAIRRMRQGRVMRQPGFDGQYGTIRLFTNEELRQGPAVGLLFDLSELCLAAPPALPRLDESAGPQAAAPPAAEQPGQPPLPRQTIRQTGGTQAILDQLDPDQRAAAQAIQGPVLIVAGPGTGKTRTLTHRLAHLIADHGVPPEQCLALTFSRRAAAEMLERLQALLPDRADRVPVMTFHALGLSILKEHGERLGLPRNLRVATQGERAGLVAQLLAISPHKATRLLERMRRTVQDRAGQSLAEAEFAAVRQAYERQLRLRGWVDFDELILLPLRLLGDDPELLAQYHARYRWISVDEYQDIDAAQYELLKLLVGPAGNLCAIGDPDQAIYGFRGADVGYFQRFCEDFPGGRRVVLGRNYRSTPTILEAALQLIAPSSLAGQRRLEALSPGLERVEIHACSTDRAEAEFVVHTVEQWIGGSTFFSLDSQRAAGHPHAPYGFSDFAVLYRTEAQADPLVEAFQRSGMPFQRRSHGPWAERPAVQAAIRAISRWQAASAPGTPVPELLDRALEDLPGPDADFEGSLDALRRLAARHADDLAGFLCELALGADVDLWDPRADRVSLLTLHAAKGLEFPVVFIVGCEEGLLPLCWGAVDQNTLAEERRLLFVGMTRARHRLILTHARQRFWKGKVRRSSPSRFLNDIRQEVLLIQQHRAARKPASLDPQRMLFD
ncbi:MAG: UvrD-helicase domain-containing protein [Thermoguttaceae bacterium]